MGFLRFDSCLLPFDCSNAEYMNAWELVKQTLAASLSAESFENWVVRTSLARTDGETLFVHVPNEATRVWMEREYARQVAEAIKHLSLPYNKVVYDLDGATLEKSLFMVQGENTTVIQYDWRLP